MLRRRRNLPGQVDIPDFKTQLLTVVRYGTTDPKANIHGPRYYKDEGITEGQRASSAVANLKTDSASALVIRGP